MTAAFRDRYAHAAREATSPRTSEKDSKAHRLMETAKPLRRKKRAASSGGRDLNSIWGIGVAGEIEFRAERSRRINSCGAGALYLQNL